jgi:stearoyl-CoA desaturase (delta-9 desaturase)
MFYLWVKPASEWRFRARSGSMTGRLHRLLISIWNLMDSHSVKEDSALSKSFRWRVPIPYVILNLSSVSVLFIGCSWVDVTTSVSLYFLRMFAITGGYHRYLSHRAYKTSRWFQFVFVCAADTAAQRGPLWWAAHHRHHHKFADTPEDEHSPTLTGFWNSHLLWWGRDLNLATRKSLVPDLCKYPELVFLDRFHFIGPWFLGVAVFGLGWALGRWAPGLGTNGTQMFVWGFVISTVVLGNGVATINSLSHLVGKRRYATPDTSQNNFWLALITLGEGWHNNHHHYAGSARQGFYWWEFDPTYYGLRCMERLGLIWDLNPLPDRIRDSGRVEQTALIRPA